LRAWVELELGDAKLANAVVRALESDRKARRSDLELSSKGGAVRLSIVSEDASSLRAALNTYLRLIDACARSFAFTKVITNG
jgi:tRNA threonylcarbamoyladenosine modification (KEOPS) complex  Pcc1 subunit